MLIDVDNPVPTNLYHFAPPNPSVEAPQSCIEIAVNPTVEPVSLIPQVRVGMTVDVGAGEGGFVGAGVGLFVGKFVGAGVGGFDGAGVDCIAQKKSII